jgi:DNA-binding SARP family transcriptional activator
MLHVSLLGEQVIADESGVRTRSSRSAALVAFLAAHAGSPQPRPRIAGLFWPESGEAQALTNLRRELHHLRQALGPEPSLVITPRDLCWGDSETCRVDLRVFATARAAALASAAAGDDAALVKHAVEAIDQYRGELLPGSYDDWLTDLRSSLERECTELCDLLAEAGRRVGDVRTAAAAARRRIQLQPLEEAGYRTLMRLQADLGDRAGALSTYHHCASVLERELGVSPDPATRREFERLLARPGSVSGGPLGTSAAAAWSASRSGRADPGFLGRSAELETLHDLWQAAANGHAGLAIVRGSAGVGKTRLVAMVAERARQQGAVISTSQCFAAAGRLALAPVAEWLRTPAVQAAAASLDEAWRTELARLIPPGGPDPSSGPGPAAGPSAMVAAWQRHRFLEGLARALLAVSRPMLLVLDNVQWCDQETLGFLPFFLGLASGARVLIAATLRDGQPDEDPALARWIGRMRETGLLTELTLQPFTTTGTARLAEAVSGRPLPAADADLLQAATGGFPLYIIEAMRCAAGPGSGSSDSGGAMESSGGSLAADDLTGVLRQRLAQTSDEAGETAGLAAAVGTNFSLDLLTEASDLDPGAVVTAVDELWRQRIVREFGDGYDFAHDLLRETAYQEISPPRRWLLHRRVAQSLERLHADGIDLVAEQLAEQYACGGRPDRAAAYYQRAAEVAASRFAHAEAIRLHREALAMTARQPPGRDRDNRELAVLQAMAAPLNARDGYSSDELRTVLDRSIELAESLGRSEDTVTGMLALWTSLFVRGQTAASYAAATRARDRLDAASTLSSAADFAVGGSAISLGKPAEGLRFLGRAAELGHGAVWLFVGTRTDVHGAAFAAHAHWLLGQAEVARSTSLDAVALARSVSDPYNLAVALAYRSVLCQMDDDRAGLRAAVTELGRLCGRYEFAYYREWGLILDGWSRGGEAGLELARRGIAQLRSAGALARMPYWMSLAADLHADCGQPGAARATLDAAIATARAHDDLWWLPEVMRLRAAYDEPSGTRRRLREAAGLAAGQGSIMLHRRCEASLTELR